MLTSKQRAALRGAANPLEPVFQIGKGEIDANLTAAVADCLAAREAADILAQATGADCVQVIGRKFVLFLKKKKDSAFDAVLAK